MAVDGMIVVCTECGGQQRDEYIRRNAFGLGAVCAYCGGVTKQMNEKRLKSKRDLQRLKDRHDSDRHLDHDPDA